jgi:hypothetical protein
MAKGKGSEFEIQVQKFFRKIFEEMGFTVIEVRRQWAGTQNGFDVRVTFLNEDDNECTLFFECKDYDSTLEWNDIFPKVCELDASNYAVDGFVALSPKVPISNIDDNVLPKLKEKFPFPIKFWDSNSHVEEMFSLELEVYEIVYNKQCTLSVDREQCLKKVKSIINAILEEKILLKIAKRIEIESTDKTPNEHESYKTNLDKKLDEVLAENDPDREVYHQLRCNYKIYLEGLEDLNNSLRLKLVRWQDNLRLKASRLTKKFQSDDTYTPVSFFNEFFETAEKELLAFLSTEKLDGDREKLLHGVVFELAAECPLDWRKKKDEVSS